MFYEENDNRKSISLVSIIAIILASLLVVTAIVVDIQNGLTLAEKINIKNQEIAIAQQNIIDANESKNEANDNKENQNKKQENKVEQQKQENKTAAKNTTKNETKEEKTENKTENKTTKQENTTKTENKTETQTQPKEQTPATKPVNNSAGKIFLTFDDGPSNATTGRLLDILKKYNVKATFFVTGNGSDELTKREYNEGHSIGLHTYSHSYKTVYASEEAFFNDLAKVDQRVYNAVGIHPKITRFPGGASNTVSKFNPGIMTRLSKQLTAKGYKYWDWNVSSGDAGETTNPDRIVENVKNGCSKDKRNIVLMHDIHEYTVNAIERIIIWAKENNYQFYRIEENMDPVHHRIAN